MKNQEAEEHNIGASDAILQLLVDMGSIGLRPLVSQLSEIIIPAILKGSELTAIQIYEEYLDKLDAMKGSGTQFKDQIPATDISNSILRYLLAGENKQHFGEAIDLVFSINMVKKPHLWNISLARSFLKTESKDSLVTILGLSSFACNKLSNLNQSNDKEQQSVKKDVDLFQTLNHIATLSTEYHPDVKPEDVLLPIFEELNELKIGVPEAVTTSLKKSLGELSKEVNNIINQLQDNYGGSTSYWTEKNSLDFRNTRRNIHKEVIISDQKRSNNSIYISPNGFIQPDKIPSDLVMLENLQKVLDQKQLSNNIVTNRLLSSYAEDDNLDAADKCLKNALEQHISKFKWFCCL